MRQGFLRPAISGFMLFAVAACGDAAPPDFAETAGGDTGDAAAAFQSYDAGTFLESDIHRLGHAGGHVFSPDGMQLLVNSDRSGRFTAYALGPGAEQFDRLSDDSRGGLEGVSWFPSDDRVLLTGDSGGNEHNSVFVREADGTVTDLLPPGEYEVAGQESGLRFLSWQNDGAAFFLTSTERDPQVADLYRYNAQTYEREMVFRNSRDQPFPTRGFTISPDGRWLALDYHHTRYDFDIYLVDLHAPDPEPQVVLTSEDREVIHTGFGFTPDSRQLIYGTDTRGEFIEAWIYDLQTRDTRPLVVADWDVTHVGYSPDGRYRLASRNVDARIVTEIRDTVRDVPVDLSFLPEGQIRNPRFSPRGNLLAVEILRETSPPDIYLITLDQGSHRRMTRALSRGIDEKALVESDVVRFESYDGQEVPGLLYRPHMASKESPVPAMVWIHGGPGYQSMRTFNPDIQYLINQGYAVYAINNRGSRGYGKTFRAMDRRRHGEADLGDVVASRTYLESIAWIDADRIGVMGRSYGGYLTLAAITFHPDVFDVAINIVGFSDYIRNITEGAWRLPRLGAAYDEFGHPETDAARLRRISPLFYAEGISVPLLVLAGANDVRVPKEQNDRLVAAARENGADVTYIVFDDEGHGFRRKRNRVRALRAYQDFLARHLKGEES